MKNCAPKPSRNDKPNSILLLLKTVNCQLTATTDYIPRVQQKLTFQKIPIDNPVITLVHYSRSELRLAIREIPLKLEIFILGDFHVYKTLRWPFYGHTGK